MKTKFIILIALISVSIFYNCQKTETETVDYDASLQTLYSNNNLKSADLGKSSLESKFFESKVAAVERVGKDHSISLGFIKELQLSGFSDDQFDLKNIHRIICYNTEVTILSVQFKRTQEEILAYVYEDKYCLFTVSKDRNQLNYNTLDGQLLFSANINEQRHSVAYNNIVENNTLNTFSNNVYLSKMGKRKQASISTIKPSISTLKSGTYEGCCRQQSDYTACVHCTLGFFGIDEWYMQAALWLYGTEVLAALYASCIGAGPSAWC